MIPEELKQYIGKIDPPHVREVERGAIRRYADALGNDNPLYYDEEYASKSRYGAIIAPPGFFGWSIQSAPSSEGIIGLMTAMINAGFYRILDGGMSYEFYLPVRPGDILHYTMKLESVSEEKKTRLGSGHFITTVSTYWNQRGEIVGKETRTLLKFAPAT